MGYLSLSWLSMGRLLFFKLGGVHTQACILGRASAISHTRDEVHRFP